MQTEIEIKFLDISPEKLRIALQQAGAACVHPERQMRRCTFDFTEKPESQSGAWLRVRDEGDKVTMSYKRLMDRTMHGTKEVTVTVDDFDRACQLLSAAGFINKSYQETKRELWRLGDTEVTIDTWPWIPTFVEIESLSEEELRAACEKLKLKIEDGLHGSVETAYQKYFDFTEEEIDHWPEIKFIPPPEWLEVKRK